MKILIDAHMLGEQEGGNETYIAGLLQGFQLATPSAQEAIVPIYNAYHRLTASQSRYKYVRLTSENSLKRLLIELPYLCSRLQASLLHVTYNAPIVSHCHHIVSVHDVIFRLYPEYFSLRDRILLSTLMPISMFRASAVLTISDTSKRDIINFYPFVRNKVVVIPLAAGPITTVIPNMLAAEKIVNNQEFILAVGTVQPRKNIKRLIEAYIEARQRGTINSLLIIVGRSAWQGSEIQKIAQHNPYSDDIIFTGYLEDAVIAALYRKCMVFIYPSIYEGFGLPLLEAMSCGAPVITSNISSLPEVAGDAALYVDPTSVEQIRLALEHLVNKAQLRDEFRLRGFAQASRFTWGRTALETFEIYKRSVNREI